MKVLKADGSRRVYIFEDFTECPYDNKELFAQLRGRVVRRAMESVPIAEMIRPTDDEKKKFILRRNKGV